MDKPQALAMLEFIADLYRIASAADAEPSANGEGDWREVQLAADETTKVN